MVYFPTFYQFSKASLYVTVNITRVQIKAGCYYSPRQSLDKTFFIFQLRSHYCSGKEDLIMRNFLKTLSHPRLTTFSLWVLLSGVLLAILLMGAALFCTLLPPEQTAALPQPDELADTALRCLVMTAISGLGADLLIRRNRT